MKKAHFVRNLNIACRRASEFARQWVQQTLPDDVRFYCPDVLMEKQIVADGLAEIPTTGQSLAWTSRETLVGMLCRNGFVPTWVNVSALAVSSQHTYIWVCTGRRNSRNLFNTYTLPPFQINGPRLPAAYVGRKFSEAISTHGKFRLPDAADQVAPAPWEGDQNGRTAPVLTKRSVRRGLNAVCREIVAGYRRHGIGLPRGVRFVANDLLLENRVLAEGIAGDGGERCVPWSSADRIVEMLYHRGYVPTWVELTLHGASSEHSYLGLKVSRIWTRDQFRSGSASPFEAVVRPEEERGVGRVFED